MWEQCWRSRWLTPVRDSFICHLCRLCTFTDTKGVGHSWQVLGTAGRCDVSLDAALHPWDAAPRRPLSPKLGLTSLRVFLALCSSELGQVIIEPLPPFLSAAPGECGSGMAGRVRARGSAAPADPAAARASSASADPNAPAPVQVRKGFFGKIPAPALQDTQRLWICVFLCLRHPSPSCSCNPKHSSCFEDFELR